MPVVTPKEIGRYAIKYEIGRGGMATVYCAHDPRFDRDVALKVLPREFMHDPTFRARFEREAHTIAALEHAAIVPVYDYGEDEGQPYLVMRYMTGGSLRDRLDKGPLTFAETATILQRIGSALDHAHSKGIVHRDLKPGNILFDRYGDAFLTDFGIAKLSEAGAALTGSTVIGTPAYLSPEQARGSSVDGRSDVYALGTILFEMLTGRTPYEAETPVGLAVKHVTEPVPRILEVKPDLPQETEPVIARAMAKDRDERFSTASELALTVGAIARGEKVSLPPVQRVPAGTPAGGRVPSAQIPRVPTAYPLAEEGTRPARGVPRWAWFIGALAVVAVVGGGIVMSGVMGQPAEATAEPTLAPIVASATATATATATVQPSDTPQPAPTDMPVPTNTPSPTPTVPTPTPIPISTSVPTPTPISLATATHACAYDVELVEVQDPYRFWYVNSSPSFGLLVRNSGACAWPEGTTLVLVSENPLGWRESWPVESAAVDQSVEVAIQLTAPASPQTLLIAWQLQGPDGQSIGSQVTRTLNIGARATATAASLPTQPPAPTQPPDAPTPKPAATPKPKPTKPPPPPTPKPTATPPPP